MEKEIIINNKLNETGRISQFMEELGVSLNIPSEIAMSMNLAIEEIIANIIQYAYPKGESSEIQLQAHITPGSRTKESQLIRSRKKVRMKSHPSKSSSPKD